MDIKLDCLHGVEERQRQRHRQRQKEIEVGTSMLEEMMDFLYDLLSVLFCVTEYFLYAMKL